MNYKLSIFTQYGQFYIVDKDASGDTGSQDFWNDEAFNDKLAIADGIIGISLANDDAIANFDIEILDSKMEQDNQSHYDHIVEGSLLIKSGKLQVVDCPNWQVELDLDVEPNWYRVRVSSLNLSKARQENPEDKYYIRIWKEKFSERKVLKRWHCS